MKIISLYKFTPAEIDIHPDSTMILPGHPLFLPENGELRVARAHIAVRICRLGKNISVKFASRYYDGVTVGLRIVPGGDIYAGMKGVVSAMDNSSVFGAWLDPVAVATDFFVKVGEQMVELDSMLPEIEAAIYEISKYMTLKMGDVILMPAFTVTPELNPSTRLAVSLGDASVVDLKIV